MTYFDSGYLAKCYVDELASTEVRVLARERDRIACSEYGRIELHAALHRKLREGSITRAHLDIVFRQLELDERERMWTWLPLTEKVIAGVAVAFRGLPESVYLRAGDAVHLVSARTYAFTEIWSGDLHLIAAAPHFGLAGRSVGAATG
jgi:predicted nucleic acid-binding protein